MKMLTLSEDINNNEQTNQKKIIFCFQVTVMYLCQTLTLTVQFSWSLIT